MTLKATVNEFAVALCVNLYVKVVVFVHYNYNWQ